MAKQKEPINPFYPVLVIVGIVFLITACAYGVMAFRGARSGPSMDGTSNGLMVLMRHHGGKLLAGELLALALSSFAAMGLDQYRGRDSARAFRAGRLAASATPHPGSALDSGNADAATVANSLPPSSSDHG